MQSFRCMLSRRVHNSTFDAIYALWLSPSFYFMYASKLKMSWKYTERYNLVQFIYFTIRA